MWVKSYRSTIAARMVVGCMLFVPIFCFSEVVSDKPKASLWRFSAPKVVATTAKADKFIIDLTLPSGHRSFYITFRISNPQANRPIQFDVGGATPGSVFSAQKRTRWIEMDPAITQAEFVSPRLYTTDVAVKVVIPRVKNEKAPYLTIIGIVADYGKTSLHGSTQHFSAVDTTSAIPDKVVFVNITPKGRDAFPCSGFLLGNGKLVLTASHCVTPSLGTVEQLRKDSTGVCQWVQFEIGRIDELSGTNAPCLRLVALSPSLDYAIFEIKRLGNYKVLETAPPLFARADAPATVISYPAGQSLSQSSCASPSRPANLEITEKIQKKIQSSCLRYSCHSDQNAFDYRIKALSSKVDSTSIIAHTCYTLGGSSGAPILQNMNIVAMHKGMDLRLSGDDYDRCSRCFNEVLKLDNWGIPMCRILEDLAKLDKKIFSTYGLEKCK